MIRPLLVLVVVTATAVAPVAWADYSLDERYGLEADGSGRAELTYLIETDLLTQRRAATQVQQLMRRFPLDEQMARTLCDEAGARLSSYVATAGQSGPARPDGSAIDYTRIELVYTFGGVEAMRVFFPHGAAGPDGKPMSPGEVSYGMNDRESLRQTLSAEEVASVKNFVETLPAERQLYFVMLSPAINPVVEVKLPEGADPRDAEAFQYRIRTTITFDHRVAATNGYHVPDGTNTVVWEYPLLPMMDHRMVYAVRLAEGKGSNWLLGGALVAVGLVLVTWALLRARSPRKARR